MFSITGISIRLETRSTPRYLLDEKRSQFRTFLRTRLKLQDGRVKCMSEYFVPDLAVIIVSSSVTCIFYTFKQTGKYAHTRSNELQLLNRTYKFYTQMLSSTCSVLQSFAVVKLCSHSDNKYALDNVQRSYSLTVV